MKKKFVKSSALTGLVAALASSVCCLSPLIALVAGIGSSATAFSWITPLRPYLILFAILAIGYAWYDFYNRKKKSFMLYL